MKRYDRLLDNQLKQLGEKVNISGEEKQDILMGINEKIDRKHANSTGLFNKTFAWAISGIAVVVFLILVSQLSIQGPGNNGNHETQAILPDNIAEVEPPPFDFKLPSYLPFEIGESSLGKHRNSVMIKYISVDGQYFTVRIEKDGVIDSYQEVLTKNNQTYYYSEIEVKQVKLDNDPKIQQLKFKAGGIKYTLVNNSDVRDLDKVDELPVYSKEELIKVAESVTTFEWPEQKETAILPNNLDEIDQPPFEYKLPSYLPFEVDQSYAQFNEETPFEKTQYQVQATYFDENEDYIQIDVNGPNTLEVIVNDSNVIESKGKTYQYSENNSRTTQILTLQENDLVYRIINTTSTAGEYEYSKDELIKVAESLTTFEWPHVEIRETPDN